LVRPNGRYKDKTNFLYSIYFLKDIKAGGAEIMHLVVATGIKGLRASS
jgi:hypothetical protein